jgi:hypothetical protein
MIIYQSTLETRHYSFQSFGATRTVALDAMREGIKKHCQQSGWQVENFMRDYAEAIETRPIVLGAAYRDGGEL